MNITDLHAEGRYRQPENLVLDVRTRPEYRAGHVPGSYNVPVDRIAADPHRYGPRLAVFGHVYIHCSSGKRARRAYEALAATGLHNLVLIDHSGMGQWASKGYPVERSISLARDVLTGLAAGLVAQLVAAELDRVLSRAISPGKTRSEERTAQLAFTVGHALLWGAVYALARRQLPKAGSLHGLPFAGAFLLACDALLAPLLRKAPGLDKIPAPFNAKELADHVAWTASAEAVHRAAERLPG
jgi:rhodanese-related sulfurtransferase